MLSGWGRLRRPLLKALYNLDRLTGQLRKEGENMSLPPLVCVNKTTIGYANDTPCLVNLSINIVNAPSLCFSTLASPRLKREFYDILAFWTKE